MQEDEMLFAPPRTLVLSEDIGDLESQITQAIGPLNTGGGIVIVGSPEPGEIDQKYSFIFPVTITIQCIENSIVNRSMSGNKVHAERLAEIVHCILKGFQSEHGWTPFKVRQWRTGPAEKFNGYVADIIIFSTDTIYSVEEVTT